MSLKIVSRIYLILLFMASPVRAMVPTVNIGEGNIVKLEVASTQEQIERGLMYRTSLADDAGMVFLFHPARPVKFWMYHTLIPLDMCFVLDGHIVKIFENVPPCRSENPQDCVTYPQEDPGISVTEVIELPTGYVKHHGIKAGDPVNFTLGEK